MMKTIYKLNVILILFSVISCSQAPSDEKDYELDMSKVKKKASIMIYEAVTNRGHIAQGNILHSASGSGSDSYFSHSYIYYDENNNVVYEEYGRENGTIYRTEKTNWFNSKNGQKHSVYSRSKYDENGRFDWFDKKIYERNNSGKLIEITSNSKTYKDRKYNSEIEFTYKYDSNGNRTEEIEYKRKYNSKTKKNERVIETKTLYSNFNSNGKFQRKLVYNSNNQLELDVVFEYPNSNSVIEYSKYYNYDQLTGDVRCEFIYNENKETVILTGKQRANYFAGTSAPSDLNEEQREAYIKEKYYGSNLKLESVNKHIERTYDSHGNLIELCSQHKNDSDLSFYQNSPCRKVASYKYNKQGDWIEMVCFSIGFSIGRVNLPTHIIVRNIEYF